MFDWLPWFGGKELSGTVPLTFGEYRKLMAYAHQNGMDDALQKLIDGWDVDGYCVPSYKEYRKLSEDEILPIIDKAIEHTDLTYADVY